MQARFARRWISRIGLLGVVAIGLPTSSHAQNPFAPTTPAPAATATGTAAPPAAAPPSGTAAPPAATAPATTTPTSPATPAAPAAGGNPFGTPTATTPTAPATTPPAAGNNPFGTPAATAPAMPATPAAPAAGGNPFGTPAPTAPGAPTTPPATGANPFGTPAPTAPGAPLGLPALPGATSPAGPLIKVATVPVQEGVPRGGFRALAPGVMTNIPSPVSVDDTRSQHDIIEVIAGKETWGERPNSTRKPARGVRFEHDVWGLDFAFKPIRYIRIPGSDGKERLIWYMVYKVKNGPTKRYVHDTTENNNLRAVPVDKPFLFIPRFELESYDVKKTYSEKVMPEAVAAIQLREDKNRKLLTTAEMTGEILPSVAATKDTPEIDRTVWGVATWEGVDPRTDRFSIYVHGLTNAYKWVDEPAAFKVGDPIGKGRTYQYQVLKLNFWRPSDTKYEHEEEIRFGIPGDVDYSWSYQ